MILSALFLQISYPTTKCLLDLHWTFPELDFNRTTFTDFTDATEVFYHISGSSIYKGGSSTIRILNLLNRLKVEY